MQFVVASILLHYFLVADVGFVSAAFSFNTFPFVSTRATAPPPPRVVSKTCLLLPQKGPCRGNISMYYYDYSSKYGNGTCRQFKWGGCEGNGNRFDTASECFDRCLSKDNNARRPKWCTLSFDYGFCFGDIERWYYDRLWNVCKKTLYSGCGGNKNNFYNKEQCDAVCRFGRGILPPPQKSKNIRDRVIINPWNTTPKRGIDQGR